jgi:nucleoside-diphosphate-sugar epimerase
MKTLIVGGTGLIGNHVADLLTSQGHEVVIGARRKPAADSPVAAYPVLLGDYAADEYSEADLESFDAVVFAAGQDVRHADAAEQTDEFWARQQSEGVPRFFALAKRAGVRRGIQIGSYYHMCRPELVDRVPYVRARKLADERSRQLADADFNVSTLNASTVMGPGQRNLRLLLQWARGELIGTIPDFAPNSSTNFISVRSVAEAVHGALEKAEPGAAYLLGDENHSYRDYFQLVFDLSGGGRTLTDVRDESHPFVAEMIVPRGMSTTFDAQPAADALGFRLNDVRDSLAFAIAAYDAGTLRSLSPQEKWTGTEWTSK